MAFVQNRGDSALHQVEWFELFARLGVTAIGYPIEYVKVLIQIGHEPYPPKPTHTLFGKPALSLPGVFAYMKHIKKVDGITGLYRGLMPKLCTNLLSGFTYRVTIERLPSFYPEDFQQNSYTLTNEQKISIFVHGLARETAARCIQIVVSHPFHIITIRTMAQFVGREEKYGGLFGSLREIYQQDGILGFFSGLVPRMLGEILVLWFGVSAAFIINTFVVEEEALKSYTRSSMAYVANAVFYPFAVVTNNIIVNNCGLKAGQPDNMPIYSDWRDCWNHLNAIKQLKRGSSLLWRYYTGPRIISSTGSIRSAHAEALVPKVD